MNGLNNFNINEIETLISNNTTDIETNTSAISTNTSQIATINTNITTNVGDIYANKNNITTNTSAISANQSNIATNTSAISANQSNIATNTSAISANQSNIATNNSAISTINTNIDGFTASGAITTLTNKLYIQAGIPQLKLDRSSNGDVEFQLVGKRTGSTSARHTKIDFQNDDAGVTPSIRTLCSIVGRVTNHTTNVGGMEILNYTDGLNPTTAFSMTSSGNFNFGGSFSNTHKVKVNGTMNVASSLHYIPQMTTYTFDKAFVTNSLWGNGNRQNQLNRTRRSGDEFSSHSSGIITFSETGTYKIKASGNLQSISYNDRLAFCIYLVFIDSTNNIVTDYFENENYSFFSWIYSRNTSDGAHGNLHFEDYLYIPSGHKIQIRNKLDVNGLDFNDTRPESNLNNYLNVEITRISGEDIY